MTTPSHLLPERANAVVDLTHSPQARLRPVPLSSVTLDDAFWAPRLKRNRETTLPSQYQQCEETGRLDNFRRASGKKDIPFEGIYFNDSDVYKWLEAASYSLGTHPDDANLRRMVDEAISEIVDAQDPNGYLNTYFSVDRVGERWTNLRDMHELYCAGHLFQAAVAHFRATSETRLLDVATRFADHICDTFGPQGREGTCGHEEIEMALVELSRTTGNKRYLEQAQRFIDLRGHGLLGKVDGHFGNNYCQDHVPFRDLRDVTGHAVRMMYLDCGAADVYAETGEKALKDAIDAQWHNMTTRRMYVTGGLGSRYEGEAFGKDYELPSDRAYTETCAAIGSFMWNWRLLNITGEARYADLMELTLYNAILPGLSLDGSHYFYQNPLADDGTHRRQAWFGCACCPPNVARLLASLPGYFYSTGPWRGEIRAYVHLYATGTATLSSPEWRGHTLSLRQETNYPWAGDITITITEAPEDVAARIFLRVPPWADAGAAIQVNDEAPRAYVRQDGDNGEFTPHQYAQVSRKWNAGDTLRLTLPMSVRKLAANPRVVDIGGQAALMRGPLVYCVEQADHADIDVRDLILGSGADFSPEQRPDLLGGVTVLRHENALADDPKLWEQTLYQPLEDATGGVMQTTALTAIPYYAWANREPGPMRVWLPVG